jgi:hypothetical protein
MNSFVERLGSKDVAEYVFVFLNIDMPRIWTDFLYELSMEVHLLLGVDEVFDVPHPCAHDYSDHLALC